MCVFSSSEIVWLIDVFPMFLDNNGALLHRGISLSQIILQLIVGFGPHVGFVEKYGLEYRQPKHCKT